MRFFSSACIKMLITKSPLVWSWQHPRPDWCCYVVTRANDANALWYIQRNCIAAPDNAPMVGVNKCPAVITPNLYCPLSHVTLSRRCSIGPLFCHSFASSHAYNKMLTSKSGGIFSGFFLQKVFQVCSLLISNKFNIDCPTQFTTLFILTPILSVMHLRFACCIVAVVTCQVFYAAMNAVDKSMSECD